MTEVMEARDREVSSFLSERYQFECQQAQNASKLAEMMNQHRKESEQARSDLAKSVEESLDKVICTCFSVGQLRNYSIAMVCCFAMFMLGKVNAASPNAGSLLSQEVSTWVSTWRWWITIALLYVLEKWQKQSNAGKLARDAMDKADFSNFHSQKDFGELHCDLQKAHSSMSEMASLLDSSLKSASYPDLLARSVRAEAKLKVTEEFNQILKNQNATLQGNVQGLEKGITAVGEGLQEVARRPAVINNTHNYDQRSWTDSRSYDYRSWSDNRCITYDSRSYDSRSWSSYQSIWNFARLRPNDTPNHDQLCDRLLVSENNAG